MLLNIIYTPGSVRYLTPLVGSLLRWSDCRYRLVSNGLAASEAALLQTVCDESPRLSFVALPKPTRVTFGEALNHLQARCEDNVFAFMDSDIFATGPFLHHFDDVPGSFAHVSAGEPLWLAPQAMTFQSGDAKFSGPKTRLQDGRVIGSTYFAVYDNAVVTAVRREYGMGFEWFIWPDIPAPVQARLKDMGGEARVYDTAKVFNLLLGDLGYGLDWREVPALNHLGGFARHFHRGHWPRADNYLWAQRSPVRRWANGALLNVLAGVRYERASVLHDWFARFRYFRTDSARRFFYVLITALVDDQPLPRWRPVVAAAVRPRVEQAIDDLIALYTEA